MDMIESRLRDRALLRKRCLIAGSWTDARNGAVFDVFDPATGQKIAAVPNADEEDVRNAIAEADRALPAWRAITGKARAGVLRRWFNLIEQHAHDLAVLIAIEGGKPHAEALGEVAYGASFVEWFAEEAKRVDGDILQSPQDGRRLLVLKQAIGVCASITPWNFPLAMITRKVSPALAAGCTIVIKPAEQTPLTALALGELAQRAGIPAGVFNIVTSDSGNSVAAGRVFTSDTRVKHISFTGSTEVGRILMAQSAPSIKKLALELGGHAPFIVFDDADLDRAVEGALTAKYRNAGQACISPNRFYVQEGIYDRFVEAVAARSAGLRVGGAFEEGSEIGPLIDQAAIAKVERHIEDARMRGAKVVTGGHVLRQNFFEPTVVAGITAEMIMSREETFGPVIGVARFSTEHDAIACANHAEYGLAAYVYTRDLARSWRVCEALEFGMVGVNTGSISNEVGPFGGVKQSGLGREGSRYGIDEYLEMKYLCVDLQ